MALFFWLFTSTLLWEHYLSILFLPLAYFVANRHVFSPGARKTLASIFLLSLGQNLILIEFVSTRLRVESAAALLIAGILKAGPLILALALLWRHQAEVFATYRAADGLNAPAWIQTT